VAQEKSDSNLAERIKTMRTQRGWSQVQLSQASGLSLRTVQRTEKSGRCSPKTLLAIAAALETDVCELIALAPSDEANRKGTFGLSALHVRLVSAALVFVSLLCVLRTSAPMNLVSQRRGICFRRVP